MVLRFELSISIHSMNVKALLAFPVPSPYRASKLVNRFVLQAYPGVSFQSSDKPVLAEGQYPSFLQ